MKCARMLRRFFLPLAAAVLLVVSGPCPVARCLWASESSGAARPGGAVNLVGTVKVGGTGCAMGTMNKLASAFSRKHPGVSVVVVPNLGSSGGMRAVAKGALDIGLSSRPLREREVEQGLRAREYARTPFVFATANGGTSGGLTLHELADIYAGRLNAWPDGSQIRLILRPWGDSDTKALADMSPEMAEAVKAAHSREGMIIAVTDQDSADLIEKVRGAIGSSTLALIVSEKRPLKPLSIDGAKPTLESLAGGSYPYSKPFFMVTGPGTSPAARAFYDFVLSEEGRAVLARTGNIATAGRDAEPPQ